MMNNIIVRNSEMDSQMNGTAIMAKATEEDNQNTGLPNALS
jgi:hypothetical protein